MSQTPASNVKGLHKHHSRGCANRRGKPTNCDYPWYGFYKRIQKGLAEWSGQRVDPRKLRPAEIVLNRFKGAIDNRTYSPDGEQRSLGSGQRFRDFVTEWRTHYAEPHDLTANSLPAMLDVLVEGFGQQTLEHLAGAPLQIERWLNAEQKERGWTDQHVESLLRVTEYRLQSGDQVEDERRLADGRESNGRYREEDRHEEEI